ncbi:YeeE/YedE family protein [Roseateles oligotrophus]|uniref:YeeE/YedE family protein n=1 Tax=Roseateles oligotrophus TaxID=1769250 RepID=A0ABT2YLT5_9BURK|nr:YeeE/YedE family protein [Roseateles oligotrophus]MCV2371019.1 YeeE/YedE family protein [Roseateles oligotrophus]
MHLPLNPAEASAAVVWGGLALGLALGALAQATRFCTRGAISDLYSYGGTSRLLMWVLAVAVAAAGGFGLMQIGWLDASRSMAWSERFLWPSYLVGGALFGYGMVLASGCPQRSLVKAASGNMKAWVTLIVAAVTAQMTLRGVLAELRVKFLDAFGWQLATPQDLGSLLASALGIASATPVRAALLSLLLLLAGLLLWRKRASLEPGHGWGGVLLGALLVAAWALTGHLGFIAEHPDTLEAAWMGTYSHRPEGFSFAAPLAQSLDLLTLWSDRNNTATFGVTLTLGVLLGSLASALLRKEFFWESFRSARDMGDHLLGGVLMGFGGVTAMGCSIGQGVTGLSLLSAGAVLALAAIVGGAWLALYRQARQIEKS